MLGRGSFIGALILLLIGGGAVIEGFRLGLGKVSEPQPGFFPFWAGVFLALLSILLLFRARADRGKKREAYAVLWKPIAVMIGLAAYVAVLEHLGYLLATFVLSAVLLGILGTKKLPAIVLAALVISLGSYILFDRLLGVSLPEGILASSG